MKGIERERAEAAASSSANIEDAVAMALSDDAIGGGAAAAGAAAEGDDDTEGGEKAPAHQVFVIDSDDDDVDDGITITGGTSRHKRSRGGGSSGSGSGKHKKVKKIEEKKARVFDLGEEMAGAGSHDSRKRLLRDLKRIKKSEELQMFKVEPARGGDDLYTWDLAFPSVRDQKKRRKKASIILIPKLELNVCSRRHRALSLLIVSPPLRVSSMLL